MNEKIDNFFLSLCTLTNHSLWDLFVLYSVAFFILEGFAYMIERLIGVEAIVRWYDLAILIVLVLAFVVNLNLLLSVKIKQGVDHYGVIENEKENK